MRQQKISNKTDNTNIKRRSFLSVAGAALGSLGIPTASGATIQTDEYVSVREAGIQNELKKLLQNQNVEGAEELLNQYNVKFDTNTVKKYHQRTDGDGGISTRSVYDEKPSTLSLMGIWQEKDKYNFNLLWDLQGPGDNVDKPGPSDPAAITFSDAKWDPIWFDFGPRSKLKKQNASGVMVLFDDPEPFNVELGASKNGMLTVQLQKDKPGTHTVFGHYYHTWNMYSVPGWLANFTLSKGDVGFSAKSTVDKWYMYNNTRV